MSISALGWIVMGSSSTRLQALSPVCPAAGSRLGTISFEGNCFSYKYRRNSSSCLSTRCCRDHSGAPELWTQQLILMLSFWSEVMSSPSHYITSLVPWDAFSSVLHRACFICGGSRCLKLLGSRWGLNVGAEVVLAPVRPGCPGARQKWVAVGCRQQKHVEMGISVAFCRCDSSLLQPRPGQVCGGTLSRARQQCSGGRCQLWASLAPSWATPGSQGSPWECWLAQAVLPARSLLPTGRKPGAAVRTWPLWKGASWVSSRQI